MIVIARIWMRVMWLALRGYRDPVRAVVAVRRLRACRARLQRSPARKYALASGRYFWDLYAPGFPSVAFDRYITGELQRIDPIVDQPPPLQSAIIAMTTRCTMKCEHCFEWSALNRQEPHGGGDLHEIVRRVRKRGVSQIFFSGGEPLRRFDDLLALTTAVSADTDVWIFSSGLGFSEEKARRLRDAGLTGVALSLDHWDAKAHDRFRGLAGSFDAVRRAAAGVRAAGLLVAFSLCPTRSFVSAENLERYARTAQSWGVSFIQLVEPKAVGRFAGRDVALEPEQQRILEAFCDRSNRDRSSPDLPAVEYIDWSVRTVGCLGAGDRYLYIDTDGALHPCPFCPGSGVYAVDRDFDEAIAALRLSGCPSAIASAGSDQ